MMTLEMMITAIENLGADASLWKGPNRTLDVTLEDFEGFDVQLGYASFDI